jgi:hypothetical protein
MPTEFRTFILAGGDDPRQHEAVIFSESYVER